MRELHSRKIIFGKQHYDTIALVLRGMRTMFTLNVADGGLFLWERALDRFCALFATDNPKFDPERFLKECRKEDKDGK